MDKSCESCRWWLGGVYACCRMNLEKECREGEYEAWEEKASALALLKEKRE